MVFFIVTAMKTLPGTELNCYVTFIIISYYTVCTVCWMWGLHGSNYGITFQKILQLLLVHFKFSLKYPAHPTSSLCYSNLIYTWQRRASRSSEELLVTSVKIAGAMLANISITRNNANVKSKHVAQIFKCLDSMKTCSGWPEMFWICNKSSTVHTISYVYSEEDKKYVVQHCNITSPLATCQWTRRMPSSVGSAKSSGMLWSDPHLTSPPPSHDIGTDMMDKALHE
jgi:hypothetical protein